MTVIFHTNAGAPVLAGDMLLSVPGPNIRTDLRLPSQPNGVIIPLDPIPSYIPIRMRRKIFIVNDHLAVGAAGSALHIAAFIDDLATSFGDRHLFSNAEIRAFLDRYASKLKPRWDVHLAGSFPGMLQPWIAGLSGSAVSPRLCGG